MELTLKIYKGKTVVKEYKADTIDVSFGVVEDVLDALDFEHMDNNMHIAGMIVKASKQLKPFLKDMFDGVTDDELRNTRMQNLVEIFKGMYDYAVHELGAAAGNTKN
jgi:hypothetical protein